MCIRDSRQTDAKGLPAGGTDKRGSHVGVTTKSNNKEDEDEAEF